MKWLQSALFILASLFFFACDSDRLEDGDKVLLQNKYGHFLNASRGSNSLVQGHPESVDGGFVFKLKMHDEQSFSLLEYENNALQFNGDTLQWKGVHPAEKFQLFRQKGRDYLASTGKDYIATSGPIFLRSKTPEIVVHRIPKRNVFGGYIANLDALFILSAFLILLFLFANSLYAWFKLKTWLFYGLIVLAHGLVAYFAISEFNFLAPWDEQFHALVARNLSQNPWIPKLYTESILYPTKLWVASEIWLHKQPLFLYQMALAIKLFGASIISVRLPSMILMALAGVFVFRIGYLWFKRSIGILASLLFCFSNYKIQLLFGQAQTDHNDLVFLFYVTASLWALIEYFHKPNKWFYRGIFLFAAGAVLNKWLLGFLVYPVWVLYLLFEFNSWKSFRKSMVTVMQNFGLAVLLVVPWQFYIFWRFPVEAKMEMELNTKHFYEVIEGHGGAWDYHLQQIPQHYGISLVLLVLFGLLAYFSTNQKKLFWTLVSSILGVFLFYSLAATKMPSFTFVLSGLLVCIIAAGVSNLHTSILYFHANRERSIHALFIGVACILGAISLNIDLLESKFINPKTGSHLLQEVDNYMLFREEIQTQKYQRIHFDNPEPSILFNCHYMYHISAMFYNENIIAYNTIPTEADIEIALQTGRKLLIFDDGNLPDYLNQYQFLIKIHNY